MMLLRLSLILTLPGLFESVLCAAPLVVGFERFHSEQPDAEGGRLLYNELGCSNCHGRETGLPLRRGPSLNDVTVRVKANWLRAFLSNPAAMLDGTVMPRLFREGNDEEITAVVHYLASLPSDARNNRKAPRHLNAERGRELFHSIGCVACHSPSPEFTPSGGKPSSSEFSYRSISLSDPGEKYTLHTLSDFLMEPLRTRPEGRMPGFVIEEQDAIDLAGYLLDYHFSDGELAPNRESFNVDARLAATGREIVAAKRCAACHDPPDDVAAQPIPIETVDGGCLSRDSGHGNPFYDLSEDQRKALRAFLELETQTLPVMRAASLSLQALNCFACHARGGVGGPDSGRRAYFLGDPELGDAGRLPPPLTGVGRKLRLEWHGKVLAGAVTMRPYLRTKMPLFGELTKDLPELLAEADRKAAARLPKGDLEAGRKLLGTNGGLGCITCHGWAGKPSLGIHSLDLSTLADRIQPGWLSEYLLDPAAYRPGTLMPSFWPGGNSANNEILNGDTARQIASIYTFAKDGRGAPEGYPSIIPRAYELIPGDRPIVQRAFLEGVGTHAILVGFPGGVHLAYDGLKARPALIWKGRFFDAYTTWFSRFVPFEQPLGGPVAKWKYDHERRTDARFLGYRLDADGNPTFLSLIGGVRVEELFVGIQNGVRRRVRWDADVLGELRLTHPTGLAVVREPSSTAGRRNFIYLWK